MSYKGLVCVTVQVSLRKIDANFKVSVFVDLFSDTKANTLEQYFLYELNKKVEGAWGKEHRHNFDHHVISIHNVMGD